MAGEAILSDTTPSHNDSLAKLVSFLGHNVFAIKSVKTGVKGAQEEYFQAIATHNAEDYISIRNGRRQLWINLQKLKAIPQKEDGSKKFHDHLDISHYTNIYVDLDAAKSEGMKDYAATVEERAEALAQIPIVEEWLSDHGFGCGMRLSTGNGAGFILPIPATPSEPTFIAQVAAFLQLVKRETGCAVDEATFDPARVVGTVGTINAKLEMEGRTNRVRGAIGGIPERIEDRVLLAFIQGLEPDPAALAEWKRKFGEPESVGPIEPTIGADLAGRLAVIFEKDPTFKANYFEPAKSDRSGREYGLCAQMWEYGFSEAEIYTLMTASPQQKWAERGDDYRIPTVRAGIETAKGNLENLSEQAKADPRILKKPEKLLELWRLKSTDPIEFDLKLNALKKATGIQKSAILAAIDKADKPKDIPKFEPVPPEILEAANEIIASGQSYEHIYQTWQKRVKGNEFLGRALLISRSVQSCLNTKGLHVYAHGKHGHGKSEGMERMLELCPIEYTMDEDVSPLSIHYASEKGMLLPGTTLLIDEMIWTDSLAGIVKRIITRFQKGASHLTVVDGEPKRCRTKPRIAIWTNSRDLQADEQLRDRFLDVPITEGLEQTKAIMEFQKTNDTMPEAPEDAERETAICQQILRDLASHQFAVKIPFAERINIPASEGTRGYNIFSDLIKGLAALSYAKRETDEKGRLLATEGDFNRAKVLYEGISGHSEERYGTAETKILRAIIDNGKRAIVEDLRHITGLSEGRIKDIIYGRGKDEQKKHGLLYKCPRLEAHRVDITKRINEGETRTIHPTEFSLPDDFRLSSNGEDLITLDPAVAAVDPAVVSAVPSINISKDSDVVAVVKEDRERNNFDNDHDATSSECGSEPEKNNSSLLPAKCYGDTARCQSIAEDPAVAKKDHYGCYGAMAEDSEKDYGGISSELQKAEEKRATKEARNRTPKSKSSKDGLSPVYQRFLGILAMYDGKGPFHTGEFLERCTSSQIDIAQAKMWIQSKVEAGKLRRLESGGLVVAT